MKVKRLDFIQKRAGAWVLYSSDRKRIIGRFKTKEEAQQAEQKVRAVSRIDAADGEVKAKLKKRREWQKKRGKEFLVGGKAPKYPLSIERQYARELKRLVNKLIDVTRKQIIPLIPSIVDEVKSRRPTVDSSEVVRLDADLKAPFGTLITEDFDEATLQRLVNKFGHKVNAHNTDEMSKIMKSLVGVNPFQSEPWLREEIEIFVQENVALITSVQSKYLNDIEGIISRGARQGKRAEVIAKEVRSRFGVTQARARLIARDQIASFTGTLQELKQKDLGVRKYRWRTSMDDRVRDDHKDREGVIFSWNDPPEDGHPGQPINCRCVAEPILSSALKDNE